MRGSTSGWAWANRQTKGGKRGPNLGVKLGPKWIEIETEIGQRVELSYHLGASFGPLQSSWPIGGEP